MIKIAIDPGINTGVAIEVNGEITEVLTLNFWSVYEFVKTFDPKDTKILIEDSSKNPHNYHKSSNKSTASRIGRNLGSVHREGNLLIEGFKLLGYNVVGLKPRSTKLSAQKVRDLTGFEGRTNNHNRDSIMILYNDRNLSF